jgi:phage regulator Rha-like protein
MLIENSIINLNFGKIPHMSSLEISEICGIKHSEILKYIDILFITSFPKRKERKLFLKRYQSTIIIRKSNNKFIKTRIFKLDLYLTLTLILRNGFQNFYDLFLEKFEKLEQLQLAKENFNKDFYFLYIIRDTITNRIKFGSSNNIWKELHYTQLVNINEISIEYISTTSIKYGFIIEEAANLFFNDKKIKSFRRHLPNKESFGWYLPNKELNCNTIEKFFKNSIKNLKKLNIK